MTQSIGTKIDELYQARAARLTLEAQVKDLKAVETQIKEDIIAELSTSGLQGAKGQVATASITHKVRPIVHDWDAVYEYIHKNDMFALLHQRITTTLWGAMRDEGEEVPGIAAEDYVDLSLTKASRS